MFYTALVVLLLIPTMFGLAEMLHLFKIHIISRKRPPQKCLLIGLKDDEAEFELLRVVEEYRWNGKKYAEKIIAVNYGLGDVAKQRCFEIAKENDILFCDFEEIGDLLKKEF